MVRWYSVLIAFLIFLSSIKVVRPLGFDLFKGLHFTPYGMLQNPYHVWPKKPSGVLRSVPALGYEWVVGWGWNFISNPYYVACLKLGVNVNGKAFYSPEDFSEKGVELYSAYHTKNVMSYDWRYRNLTFSLKYFLAGRDSLTCLVSVSNEGPEVARIAFHAVGMLFSPRPYLMYGCIKDSYLVLSCKALGVTVVLGGNVTDLARKFALSDLTIRKWVKANDFSNMREGMGLFVIFGVMSFKLSVPPHSVRSSLLILAKGSSYEEALTNFRRGLRNAFNSLEEKLREDLAFWSNAPRLIGDWPKRWVRGFIYDFETLRMVIYPSRGVFKHKWDVMHVNWPRCVLAETSIDMFIMSYANVKLAEEVLLGLFEDAPLPNVPCVHADGSFNMVAMDGSKCGTSPAWCFPFYLYSLLYARALDKEWLRKIYPYWSSYLRWWLKNRSDREGWLHYKCSWESGEDVAPRFGIQVSGGQLIENIRPSELQAVMAYAAKAMAFYAKVLGLGEGEVKYWENVYRDYYLKLQRLWFKGWFHDYDVKEGKFTKYKDPLHLAPIFLGLASRHQIRAMLNRENVNELLGEFKESVGVATLDWPSLVFPYFEALWAAGKVDKALRNLLIEQVYRLINRVYSMTDARVWKRGYPIPGVSYENWGPPGTPRVEGYGWGALTALTIIRYVIGFREVPFSDHPSFLLSPGLPKEFLKEGKRYRIGNLSVGDVNFELTYKVIKGGGIKVSLRYSSNGNYIVKVMDEGGRIVYKGNVPRRCGEVRFLALNGMSYKVEFISVGRSG